MKVGIVNYKNTKPLLYGLEELAANGSIVLEKNYPAAIAQQLSNHQLDIALLPIAEIPNLETNYIVGNHCISSYETVGSVSLFSQVSLTEIETILLDFQSCTSVKLIQVLCKEVWKISPQFKKAEKNFIAQIEGTTAAVIIGDRAFEQKNIFRFEWDLAAEWFSYTQLPFVFAIWISTQKITQDFELLFEAANKKGLSFLPAIATEQHYPFYNLEYYYTKNICYQLDEPRKKSMQLFLEKIKNL
jgi:chorismate dehydratase